MSLGRAERVGYFVWAASRSLSNRDRACPGCGSSRTHLVRRKYVVTTLWECSFCSLRFRMPKDDAEGPEAYYQRSYSEGFTTDCPSDAHLSVLLSTKFIGSPKDFGGYIAVLRASGLADGDKILDFGCSWGYGSWQLQQAGFRVYSYDISRPRAEYARAKLGCRVLDSPRHLPERVRCMFSSHVIEHLARPDLIWEIASTVLTEDGVIVSFCPNGAPAREFVAGRRRYDSLWGKVHPLMITPRFLKARSASHGYSACAYSTPYSLDDIAQSKSEGEDLTGDELCMVAKRVTQPRAVSTMGDRG